MKNYEFDIDLFFLAQEPENWYDTIEVPLSDDEADVLANAIIDQHFVLPRRPNDDIEGDDYIIKERAPGVHARILKQMEDEAECRGWTDCVSDFRNANIWFGHSLHQLAESYPRWQEFEQAKATQRQTGNG